MGRLTTHVLDTAAGRPAAGLKVELYRPADGAGAIASAVTNADGRTAQPLLEGADFTPGNYELRFHAGDYHRRVGTPVQEPPFLDVIPIRFGISDADGHYHVPLLLSGYGYTTYRGS